MKKTQLLGSIGLVTGAVLTLAACGQKSNDNAGANDAKKFPQQTPKKAVKKGGTLSYALETDTPFTGIFNNELANSAIDSTVAQFGNESLFDTDDSYKINNKGPATFKLDRKAKTVTIEVKKGVKWSDGKQVTAKDVEYEYEIMANKGSKSQRYTASLQDIVGLTDYHDGKSKTISGIEMPDGENGRKVVIHFKEMKPGMLQSGNGYFLESASPYHQLKNIPFDKLQSSDAVRKNPIFFGPYKISKIVRGQSVTWVPNKYYWRGTPKLDKITISVVNPNSASQAIKSHKFDIADVVNSQWDQVKNTKGVNFVAKVPLAYSYMGFKVGKWKDGRNVMDPKAKMNNKSLRQAMAYAMNIDAVTKRYTHGLSFRVPTLIPEQFGDYFNKNVKGYSYNLKKANQLLDKAGYKKKGTYRVQPNGKPLTINLAAMAGNSTLEPITRNYIQQWKKIGLNVKLTTGRLIEFNSFYDKIQNDAKDVDVFMAAWSLSSEPSPNDLYNEKAPFNFTRFVTKKNTQLLAEMDSQKAFNHKYRVDKFHEWQKYMNDEAYVVPTTNSYAITAVNSKITGYSLKPSDGNSLWYKVGYAK
ncbi:Oligopeptide ABC superfamily ATP binding cassette transporter, binding protein [Lactobacillus helveticus CIRM-BIA 101]|uniref:Oligopeptide ABC superfamily ATP binding cassette transporter, binding protein n=1 Tax=Lactobacillus helveticus CIRM-BIA 104 TaxID=1226333 RepID=U6FA40_LACHE|nr:oligopeptide ABC transporter substrate-binding protein [Lactobacillus helveticus]EEW68863.1 ABC transporter, substrate-binding protein, family 5 [Lactobacillus helveticus DSM 20075 = CGMCC 1.1877]KGL03783.1 peptide ABC transporter substrate-binding protein [Lactobacillus helveticus]KGL05447.1 peptide ABC transporter substrate-binding protein [Lactobacillus helveticus]KRL39726.1 oligopeptide ABC superfamily ATP binding cassette transporter, binding protein [Lactobacillus helveticus DSM 20075 